MLEGYKVDLLRQKVHIQLREVSVVAMYMIRGCGFGGQLLIFFNEPIDPMLGAFVVCYHFEDVGQTE